MERFEVRGDHPPTATTFTSGRVTAADAQREAQELVQNGYVNITIVDHETGVETTFEASSQHVSKDT